MRVSVKMPACYVVALVLQHMVITAVVGGVMILLSLAPELVGLLLAPP